MGKRIIVIEISGRQSEDMEDAKWVAQVVAKKIGGYNEAFITNVTDEQFENMAADESAESL
jgi:hypothetical protein